MKTADFFKLDAPIVLFLIFLAFINGTSWAFADSYDHFSNVDVQTYTGLFNFEWDQHPVRRYRPIIPMLAAGFHFLFGGLLDALSPNEFPGDFATIMSFLFVNNVLMALFAFIVFRICQAVVGDCFWPCLLGVGAVLTCRWTPYLAGSALVDSLYLLTVSVLLLGIITKDIRLIIFSIYLGPWSKEAYIFFVPLLIFVDRSHWLKLAVHLGVSGIFIFSFRYLYDMHLGVDFMASFQRDASHFGGMGDSLKRLFSFHGLYEVVSIGGVWNLFLVIGITKKEVRQRIAALPLGLWFLFLSLVLFQALLSYELARMFYLATPLLAILVALVFRFFSEQTHTEIKP